MQAEGSVSPTRYSNPRTIPLSPSPERYAHGHYGYLSHPAYHNYQRMHKLSLGREGSKKLEALANKMAQESDPLLMATAASAYYEAGIVRDSAEPLERLTLIAKAELLWEGSLHNEGRISGQEGGELQLEAAYRVAMNLACLPMVRSMVLGDVKPEVIDGSIEKLVQIGGLAAEQRVLAEAEGDYKRSAEFVGVGYEIDALISLMYSRDPRYIAIPSFQRAGTGYYYPEQTHDIALISQHYGKIRNITPIEVKSRRSRRHIERYRALIIGGRAHLTVPLGHDPNLTREVYERVRAGEGSPQDEQTVEAIQLSVRALLAAYKRTGKYKPLERANSHTTYYKGYLGGQKHTPDVRVSAPSVYAPVAI